MRTKIFNLIILDESGSMTFIERQAVSGVIETIQTIQSAQKKHIKEQEHFVTLISFSSEGVKYIYNNLPVSEIADATALDYHPCGGTPLYDAIGNGIVTLRSQVTKDDKVLVTIITDGEENCSKEWNHSQISKLIETQKEQHWVFTYIGTNQDVEKVSVSLNISNSMAFACSAVGTTEMFKKEKVCRERFFDKLTDAKYCDEDLAEGYFDEK